VAILPFTQTLTPSLTQALTHALALTLLPRQAGCVASWVAVAILPLALKLTLALTQALTHALALTLLPRQAGCVASWVAIDPIYLRVAGATLIGSAAVEYCLRVRVVPVAASAGCGEEELRLLPADAVNCPGPRPSAARQWSSARE